MIEINHSTCDLCGRCSNVCHEYCIYIVAGKVQIDHQYCSTCCQCIAVCQEKAMTWEGNTPVPFDRSLYPTAAQMEEFFAERRTCRDFKDDSIDRPLLEQVAVMATKAPTHNFNMRVNIIDDPGHIWMIDNLIFRFIRRLYRFLYKPRWVPKLIKLIAPGSEAEYLKAKPKLESAIYRGGPFRSMPAAIMLVIGKKRIPLSLESAQYALYTMDLYAQSLGLGCRNLVGNQMILNHSKWLRRTMKIKRGEKIYGTLALGYPAVTFRNKVTGKQLQLQWN
jgi:ferredoxin